MDIAILVTLPLLTYQIYAFVIPAFSREHHKRIRGLALMIPVLFVCGVAFGWFLVLPPALRLPADLRRQQLRRAAARDRVPAVHHPAADRDGRDLRDAGDHVHAGQDADHQRRVHAPHVALRRGAAGASWPACCPAPTRSRSCSSSCRCWCCTRSLTCWSRRSIATARGRNRVPLGRRERLGGRVILGADWVIPVDAEPIADGRVEIARRADRRARRGRPGRRAASPSR